MDDQNKNVKNDEFQGATRQVLIQNQEVELNELLNNGSVLTIRHDEARYVLRKTKQGKLILTK